MVASSSRVLGDDPVENIVAGDGGDSQAMDAQVLGDFAGADGSGDWVGCAHVGDDADFLFMADGQDGFHAFSEERVVAEAWIVALELLGEGDGAFGEALEDEVGDVSFEGEFDGWVDSVSGVAGACADSDGFHGWASAFDPLIWGRCRRGCLRRSWLM